MGIEELRNRACEIVDGKTREIISGGFHFDNYDFSLSLEAQKNLLWMYMLFLSTSLPDGTRVTAMDNRAYSLRAEKMPAFFDLANNSVTYALASGRDLKDKIVGSNDLNYLKTFYDPRT